MTITPHGYKDWGRYVAQADVTHLNVGPQTISAGTSTALVFVGYTPYVGLLFQSSVGRFRFQANYFADSGGIQLLGTQEIHVAQGGVFDQAVPILGPWLRVDITPDGANRTFSLLVFQASGLYNAHDFTAGGNPVLISSTGTAIGAGATVDVDAGNTFAGGCHWVVEMGGLAFEAFLRVRDYLAVVTNIGYFARPVGTAGIIQPVLVMLPGQQARISVINASGGASTFNAYLVARPLAPGE